jgi:3,4-dihydroxy 2-butanone 4-phosphate synthase/GTP cyclohydrolase II
VVTIPRPDVITLPFTDRQADAGPGVARPWTGKPPLPPRLQAAIAAIRAGGMVVVVDDPDRENEGDLVMAASSATPAAVNFMARHGRGLICVAMHRDRLDQLAISAMTDRATDPRGTAFHVGVDLRGQLTGISAIERSATIRALAGREAMPEDFTQPGHVFPLAYRPGGVLARAGHTEASVDLVTLAGVPPAAAICEIADDDGAMMRLPELERFARHHQVPLLLISELRDCLRGAQARTVVERVSSAHVPLKEGGFTFVGYRDLADGREHVAAVLGEVVGREQVLARLHSECLTGDAFGSLRCDCGTQLARALSMIAEVGAGVVIYLRGHEGRGTGRLEKLKAYQLQDQGLDKVETNLALGHPADARDYTVGAAILADLEIASVRLITNNREKIDGLVQRGVPVAEKAIETDPTTKNVRYLGTKQTKLGHTLQISEGVATLGRSS